MNARRGCSGTVKSVIGGTERPVERTTPEAIDLQRTFREMLDGGDVACAMEVSSHALELHRADAIHFAAAIFTNLTQDHLDFHGTMEEYFAGQAPAVHGPAGRGIAVINVDDAYGARLAGEIPEAVTFAVDRDADYRADAVETHLGGSRFTVHGPDGVTELRSPLPGRFNVYNVLGALAAARAVGVPIEVAAAAIETAGHVPGTVSAGRRRAGVRRAGRLRAHPRLARERLARRSRLGDGRATGPGCTSCSDVAGTAIAASAR